MTHTKGKLKLAEVKRLILDETRVPIASVATYGGRRIRAAGCQRRPSRSLLERARKPD